MAYATYQQKKTLMFIVNNATKYENGERIKTIPVDVTNNILILFNGNAANRIYNSKIEKSVVENIINKYLPIAQTNRETDQMVRESHYHC